MNEAQVVNVVKRLVRGCLLALRRLAKSEDQQFNPTLWTAERDEDTSLVLELCWAIQNAQDIGYTDRVALENVGIRGVRVDLVKRQATVTLGLWLRDEVRQTLDMLAAYAGGDAVYKLTLSRQDPPRKPVPPGQMELLVEGIDKGATDGQT